MMVKAKRTSVVWEVEDGSPTAKRVKEQPEDYEIVGEEAKAAEGIPKSKKGKGPE